MMTFSSRKHVKGASSFKRTRPRGSDVIATMSNMEVLWPKHPRLGLGLFELMPKENI